MTGTITITGTQTVGDDLVSYRWHIVFTGLDKLGPYRISIKTFYYRIFLFRIRVFEAKNWVSTVKHQVSEMKHRVLKAQNILLRFQLRLLDKIKFDMANRMKGTRCFYPMFLVVLRFFNFWSAMIQHIFTKLHSQ